MRSRGVVVLAVLVGSSLVVGLFSLWRVQGAEARRSPQDIADAYFAAWGNGDLEAMGELVDGPPADFAEQHRALSRGLTVNWVRLEPRSVVQAGPDEARVDFTVTRGLAYHGEWRFRSVLRLVRADDRWRVSWAPSTLYPGMRTAGTWALKQVEVPAVTFTARNGEPLPKDGALEPYVSALADRLGDEDAGGAGWAVELTEGTAPPRRVKLFGVKDGRKIKTTLDPKVQAAAEKAVEGAGRQAAIVAIRPGTGEILAVADGLGGLGAFIGMYPPGSTFKAVTAGALLAGGAGAGTGVDCPAQVVTAQRTIRNHDGESLGRTDLRSAFAQSCNTTFSRLAVEDLGAARLGESARRFGFGADLAPGLQAATGSFPVPESGAELAEAAIGQGRVLASPLLMASVAAGVRDGTWRAPRLVAAKLIDDDRPAPRPVPGAAALRTMMRAVVTEGTAAGAGLPAGTAGKTGTAEFGAGGSHAWFIGYKGDVAFAVLVPDGGSGPKVAAPLAARFLR